MKLDCKKKIYFGMMALFLTGMAFSTVSFAKTVNKSKIIKSVSADNAIVDVKSYGFVDLEGAKTSAIIVEYNQNIKADSVDKNDYEITDYAIYSEKKDGFEKTVEIDRDNTKGNEGQITKVYVNDKPEISKDGGTKEGKYVIIEVNTDYMLTGQNLSYTSTMMAGVKQIGEVVGKNGKIAAGTREISNYTLEDKQQTRPTGETVKQTVIKADKNKIILPEFDKNSGWKINYIGNGGFKATKAYSEYTGKYENFELPYAIYVPNKEVLEKNKGNISVVLHMEHAGANDIDPMASLTSTKAATKMASKELQEKNPAIIIVPQVEESRRSTNDVVSSSEANTAIWELLDSVLKEYKGYINESRIYGTGQSMGGMLLLDMAAQRDNFFAGVAILGSQWSNNYNKDFQNNGAAARSPQNDLISFNGFGLDKKNYQNWYYMISDDNILVHTAADDLMATSLWKTIQEYFKATGVEISHSEWDPYLSVEEQNKIDKKMTTHDNTKPGTGINWGEFSRGSHMSTWKYGYQIDYPFEWLFEQRRETAQARGKVEQLKNKWIGRDKNGNIKKGSGTAGLNTAQYTPNGKSDTYIEDWKPYVIVSKLISDIPNAEKIVLNNRTGEKYTKKSYLEMVRKLYNLLSKEDKKKVKNYDELVEAEK